LVKCKSVHGTIVNDANTKSEFDITKVRDGPFGMELGLKIAGFKVNLQFAVAAGCDLVAAGVMIIMSHLCATQH